MEYPNSPHGTDRIVPDEAPDDALDDASLSEAVVTALITAGAGLQQRLDRALGDIKGITYNEYRLLDAMATSAGTARSRVDLARAVGLTPSGVTRALRPLEKLGMVETVRDTRDARRSLASLTDQGRELLTDAAGVLADSIAGHDAIQAMPPAEARRLVASVRGLDR